MTVYKFAVIVGEEVAGVLTLDDQNENAAVGRWIAAYSSDPKIVPVTTGQPVEFGWTWDGQSFISPL